MKTWKWIWRKLEYYLLGLNELDVDISSSILAYFLSLYISFQTLLLSKQFRVFFRKSFL